MGEWFWIKFAPADEWQPAWLDERGRYYPATENGWFNAEEIWEIGPPVACPDVLIEAEKRGAEQMRERAAAIADQFDAKRFYETYRAEYNRKRYDVAGVERMQRKALNIQAEDARDAIRALPLTEETPDA